MTDRYSASSYFASVINILFGAMTLQEVGVMIGIFLGILTYLTNLYYKRKQDKRESELHAIKIDKEEIYY